MNKIITTLAILLSTTLFAQLDITNDFESWTFTNTAGLEPYGAITTTLAGGGAYPNNDTTLMTSTWYEVAGDLEIDFKVNGFIERNYDYMRFQYNLGNGWITLKSMTGHKNNRHYSLFLEAVQGMIQFRFALVTDESVNTYGSKHSNGCGFINLMYYDVSCWNLWSDNALPVEFDYMTADCNSITWGTHSEYNSSHYIVETSIDGYTWSFYERVEAQGFTTLYTNYSIVNNDSQANYFKLTQYDFDGVNEVLDIKSVDCGGVKSIEGYYNTMGQEITPDTQGLKIVRYTDGTTKTIY